MTRRQVAVLALRTVIDTLVVATTLAAPAFDWTADPTGTRLTCLALRFAVATMMAIDLGIDALVVAHRPVVATLALTADAVVPRRADVTATATVVRVGINVGAHSTAADFVRRTQAAISSLAVMQPLMKESVRVHPTAEAGDEQVSIVAEIVACGLLVRDPLAIGGIPAVSGVATGRGGSGCLERSPDQHGSHTGQQSLKHPST